MTEQALKGRVALITGGARGMGREMAVAYARAGAAGVCITAAPGSDETGDAIRAELDEAGLADDTIVIFTSDHGETLGDHGLIQKGCRFYEGLVHVPLIWRWPGCMPRIPASRGKTG